ncbi:L,D-transpeptidase [Sphingomonas abietis]|uniref:L,D-transpeptidase n=1 Tax=Sphingomonas abietis TaxID=3012344 RepID=A0ABY7NSY1_9SPHN|nr:L,D-transpeptidase [Sphingomonas abietis]WBO24610.1 L,D-transpeptidase [Sphingomonas abietis]
MGALAQEAVIGAGSVANAIHALKAGEFLWAPEVAPSGPVLVIVSIETQRANVYRNGVLIGVSTASIGKAGHETPIGIFTILQKQMEHKSNLYDDAPMPFMQRLTWEGVAMHAGNLPGYPASHGCIRLPLVFACDLYGVSKLGMTVVVTDGASVPRVAPTPDILNDMAGMAETSDTASVWQPERAPTGPLSIVISGADRRLLVLRNGVVIGSTPISMKEPIIAPKAFSLRSVEGSVLHWMQLPLPGEAVTDAEPADTSKMWIPDPFRRKLAAILAPGATVVMTPDTLAQGDTGHALTVIAGQDEK